MKSSSRYVPKRKAKIKWKLISPLLVLLLLLSYIIVALAFPKPIEVKESKFKICDYNLVKAQNVLSKVSYPETIDMQEHLFYGETLNLFHSAYNISTADYFIGKSIILRNMCNGKEWMDVLERGIDGQIPLEQLEEGFYEVYITDNLLEKRVFSNSIFYDTFYTVRRNGFANRIDVVADPDLIETPYTGKSILDKPYLFIKVSQVSEVPSDVVDVFIDPAHSTNNGYVDDFGEDTTLGKEADILLAMATKLKSDLESYGLNVLLARTNSSIVNTYGVGGRLDTAYASHAKYYISLDFRNSTISSNRGSSIVHSHYSSNVFATAIFKSYIKSTGLVSITGSEGNIDGVIRSNLIDNLDAYFYIREAGGKILNAGIFSESSKTNASFAKDNIFGMQAVALDLLYVSNPTDFAILKNNQDTLVENITLGFVNYLKVSQQE